MSSGNALVVPLSGKQRLAPPFGRVLVAKPAHLGDLVISLPLAAALKRADPGCTVIFLTSAATAEVARRCPAVDEVVGLPDRPAPSPDQPDGGRAWATLLAELLASLKLNIFIGVNNWPMLALAARLAGIPVRIGSLYRWFNWRCYTHLVAIARSWRGLNKRVLDLQYLAPLGIGVPNRATIAADGRLILPIPPPRALPWSAGKAWPRGAASLATSLDIVLSPASITATAHRWPWQSYAALIDRLDRHRYRWLICGLDRERQHLLPLLHSQAGARNVHDLVGKLDMQGFMQVVAASDGLIGGSSGPVHLAAALGVRTLGLYQSRRSEVQRWRPLAPDALVLHSDVPCRGERGRGRGRDAVEAICPCIAAIRPATVAAQVEAWFAPGRWRPRAMTDANAMDRQ